MSKAIVYLVGPDGLHLDEEQPYYDGHCPVASHGRGHDTLLRLGDNTCPTCGREMRASISRYEDRDIMRVEF